LDDVRVTLDDSEGLGVEALESKDLCIGLGGGETEMERWRMVGMCIEGRSCQKDVEALAAAA
jgi:hypothetical protein